MRTRRERAPIARLRRVEHGLKLALDYLDQLRRLNTALVCRVNVAPATGSAHLVLKECNETIPLLRCHELRLSLS